jgi:VanZ family protein
MNPGVKKWCLVACYAFLITGLSSIPAKRLPHSNINDKVAHTVLYTGAAIATRNALISSPGAILAVAAYGIFDENYQRLVPGRTCSIYDWFADLTGAILGTTLYVIYEKIRSRKKTS